MSDIEKDLELELDNELDAEIDAELANIDLDAPEQEAPVDSEDVPRSEEGFNLMSPVGLAGAAASKIFGLDTVKSAVETGAESVSGALSGLAQGTAMPFAAGLAGAANQAVEDALDPNVDVSVEAGYNAFTREKRAMEQALSAASAKAPVSNFIGNMAAYANVAKVLGIPLSAASKTKDGALVMDTIAAKQLTAYNAAHGFFTANEDQNKVTSAILSAGGGLLMDKLGIATINKWNAKKAEIKAGLQGMSTETTLDILTPSQANKVVQKLKTYVGNNYENADEAADDVFRFLGLDKAKGINDMAVTAKEYKEIIGKRLGDVVESMEDLIDADDLVDGQVLANNLKQKVGSVSKRAMEEKKYLGASLQRGWDTINEIIDSAFIKKIVPAKTVMKQMKVEIPDPETGGKIIDYKQLPEVTDAIKEFMKMGPKSLHMTKTRLAKSIQRELEAKQLGKTLTPTEASEFKEVTAAIVGEIIESLDDVAEGIAKKVGTVSSTDFKRLRRQYGLINKLEEAAHSVESSKYHNSAFGLGSQAITFKGFYLASLGGLASGAPGVAAGVMMNYMLKSPQTPPKLVRGLRKLSSNIQVNPNGKLAMRLQTLLNSDVDNARVMEEQLTAMIAEANLIDSAVARDMDDVLAKKNSIEALIRDAGGEEAASKFLDAIESGDPDQIGAAMEFIEDNIPNASKFIQSGTGWNGKVYSEEKKQTLANELERMDISRIQKSKLKKDLFQQGIVPKVEQEPERFIQFRTRDKKRPQY